MDLQWWLGEATRAIEHWQAQYGAYQPHPSTAVDDERFGAAFADLTARLKDNYPFFHPGYAGQMLKPPHPVAVVGYLAAMLINPNNHALDGGPATAAMEKEVVASLAAMFGYREHLGHLTTSGTIANLEALYVARQTHPGRGIAYSADAHYTHGRMCGVLGMTGTVVPTDAAGRMDVDALAEVLRSGSVGTVVATLGTTGLGAVDPLHEIAPIAAEAGARVHVDAAYGGFFMLLKDSGLIDSTPWRAVASADSIVVDPHKHGLQPYGCGAVLFRDPAVGRFYVHDSPYTYFTSDELHLGEISLECSRSGAAAAALWLTLQLLPLTPEGLGAVLAPGRRAALRWVSLLAGSEVLAPYQSPDLDIVSYFPRALRLSVVDAASARIMHEGMTTAVDPVFLSVLRVDAAAMARRHPEVVADADGARILRSVLMKPESEPHLDELHARVEELARAALGGTG